VVRIEADGYWYIVDRIKDIIVTGGEKVYSKPQKSIFLCRNCPILPVEK